MNKEITKVQLFEDSIFEVKIEDANNSEILEFYEDKRFKYEGHTRSNYGGWQAFISPGECKAYDEVLEKINVAANDIFKNEYGLNDDIKIANSWLNANDFGSSNLNHTHPGCAYSGVYYINASKDDKKNGSILFENPQTFAIASSMIAYGQPHTYYDHPQLRQSYMIPPKVGYAYLFMPWIQHAVTRNLSHFNRIVIGMNFNRI